MGVAELLLRLVEREQPTAGEQHHRDDERPEVALAGIPERMGLRRLAPRPAGAEHEEALVGGVGDGVDGLGEE